jgi:hypothetical protein
MSTANFEHHRFKKSNLITKIDKKGPYDIYRCETCGVDGKRYGLSNFVQIASKRIPPRCYFPDRPAKVKILDNPNVYQFGLNPGEIHAVLPAPPDYDPAGIWVHSPSRNEPCRLVRGEYQDT